MNNPGTDPALSIKPGEVSVWLLDLNALDHSDPAWERLLPREELARSARYRFEKDRLRFIARRGILRQLLGIYTGRDPAEIVYAVNPYGKLALRDHALKFNLSCSQTMAAFAFAQQEIGVDIEQVRPIPELGRMTERWFSPEERAGLEVLPPEMQAEAFFHIWTQKEAFLKAHGEGLSRPLQDFSVSPDPYQPGRVLSIGNGAEQISTWQMYTRKLAAGWRLAVCVRAANVLAFHFYMPDMADFVSCVTIGKLPPPV